MPYGYYQLARIVAMIASVPVTKMALYRLLALPKMSKCVPVQ
jgi:hypothetical protein